MKCPGPGSQSHSWTSALLSAVVYLIIPTANATEATEADTSAHRWQLPSFFETFHFTISPHRLLHASSPGTGMYGRYPITSKNQGIWKTTWFVNDFTIHGSRRHCACVYVCNHYTKFYHLSLSPVTLSLYQCIPPYLHCEGRTAQVRGGCKVANAAPSAMNDQLAAR